MNTATIENQPHMPETPAVGVPPLATGSDLQASVSQAIQDAIAAHIAEYSKLFPEQVWGAGGLHARILPAVMAVLPNNQGET